MAVQYLYIISLCFLLECFFVLMFFFDFVCLCFQKKKQRELKESWARWTACLQGQPITAVRFGLQHNSLFIIFLFIEFQLLQLYCFMCQPALK